MIIRKANKNDLDEIIELWKEFMDFHAELDPAFARSESGHIDFYEYAKKQLADKDRNILVAELNGSLVGYCTSEIKKLPAVFKDRNYGYIEDIAVNSNHRNRGIGKQLFDATFQWFLHKNISRMELNVLAGNVNTEKFWEGLGFKIFTKKLVKHI